MFKVTNVTLLGTNYTVSDSKGHVIKTVQIIPYQDILDASLGVYTEDFGSYDDYLQKSISVMTGYEGMDPNTVLWYASHEKEVVLTKLIEYAVKNGFDKIILEHLDESVE